MIDYFHEGIELSSRNFGQRHFRKIFVQRMVELCNSKEGIKFYLFHRSSPDAERVVRVSPEVNESISKVKPYPATIVVRVATNDVVLERELLDLNAGVSIWKILFVKVNRE